MTTIAFNSGTVYTLKPCPHSDCGLWLWVFNPKGDKPWTVFHAPRNASDMEILRNLP